ncbi:hypothetical protein ANN_24966 [Periplaneta americana]|uniref:Uncharacterized protein n=1 Tax=Periplaneta americana TaxID=6978 RepID=A0ABQ8S022_PERAM|nr:hypothetical protein ANN_24966 [Periplaneta americana]
MAGLCEGGNEPPCSLKAIKGTLSRRKPLRALTVQGGQSCNLDDGVGKRICRRGNSFMETQPTEIEKGRQDSKDSARHAILRDDLNMNRVAAKFCCILSRNKRTSCRDVAQDLLDTANTDPGFLNTVITGDESWFVRVRPRNKKTVVAMEASRVSKAEESAAGQMVTKEYSITMFSGDSDAVRRKRPDIGQTNNWHLHHDNGVHIHPN